MAGFICTNNNTVNVNTNDFSSASAQYRPGASAQYRPGAGIYTKYESYVKYNHLYDEYRPCDGIYTKYEACAKYD